MHIIQGRDMKKWLFDSRTCFEDLEEALDAEVEVMCQEVMVCYFFSVVFCHMFSCKPHVITYLVMMTRNPQTYI